MKKSLLLFGTAGILTLALSVTAPLRADWCAMYYDNKTLSGSPDTVRTDNTVDNDWGYGSPGGTSLGNDNFSVRWTTTLTWDKNGKFTLRTNSDDGIRVYVDGTLVIDDWTDHAPAYDYWTSPTKSNGDTSTVVVEYYENGGGSVAQLDWDRPGGGTNYVAVPDNRTNAPSCSAGTPTKTLTFTKSPTPTPVPPASTKTATRTSTPLPGSPTKTPAIVLTPTLTRTPTVSPTATKTVWSGLPSSERLYGLEYIPFPPDSANPNSGISDLSLTKTSASSNNIGRNTARWRVVLRNMNTGVLAVETRLGPYGVTCTTGYFNLDDYDSATSLTLPDRPTNLSTTYAWLNKPVPPTERFDAVGDPRFVPYADVIGQPATKDDLVLGGYNWFFKDLNNSGWADYQAEYVGALPEATRNRYNGQPNVDVPKLMMLWREGILISRSIYNSLSGWSNYYIGLGGEIGGDSSNNLTNGVPAYGGPWNSSSSTYNVDEIIAKHDSANVDGAVMLASSASGSNWRGLPFLGELWPDNLYASDWCSSCGNSTWGNLRNPKQGGSSYRLEWQNAGVSDAASQTYFSFAQIRHRNQDPGAPSFMNGNDSSGAFEHSTPDYDANLLTDGTAIAQQLNFAMPATFSVNRPWDLNSGSTTPPEWNDHPYKDRRISLALYPGGTSGGFYDSNSTNTTTKRASSAIRATSPAIDGGTHTLAGFFVVSGLKPSTESGINFVARFSLLSCLRTFLDAGAPTESAFGAAGANFNRNKASGYTYRIQPPPLVQITEPYKGQSLTGYQSIVLRWKERYARWDDDRYTESYPCIDATSTDPNCSGGPSGVGDDPSLEWHDSADLVFNIIYSMDGGSHWFSALSDDPAVPGVYMPGTDSIPYSASHLYNYSWPVNGLPAGAKKVRVEAFRNNLALHYAYHEINIETAP